MDESLGSGVLLLFRITGDLIILTLLLFWNRFGGNGINHTNKLSPNKTLMSQSFLVKLLLMLFLYVFFQIRFRLTKLSAQNTLLSIIDKSIAIIVLFKAPQGNPRANRLVG